MFKINFWNFIWAMLIAALGLSVYLLAFSLSLGVWS